MVQKVGMTQEEEIKMYMKSSKKELCEMLIEANRHLENLHTSDVNVSLPSTEEAESYLKEYNLYPHVNKSLKVLTEDSEGSFLDKEDVINLIKSLNVYISS